MRVSTGIMPIALAMWAALPCLALAQASPLLVPGARVRVTTTGLGERVGRLTRMDNDMLTVADASGEQRLPRAQIVTVDVSVGTRRHALAGLGYGTLVGAAGGAIFGAAGFSSEPCSNPCLQPQTRGENALLGAAVLGVLGGVTGLAIGARHKTDRWQRVTDEARVGIAPMRGGVGAVLRF